MKEYQFLLKYSLAGDVIRYALIEAYTSEMAINYWKTHSSNSSVYLGIRKLNTTRNPGRFITQ